MNNEGPLKKFNATGALICGGKSSRFGEDKSNITLNGKTLLELSLEKLSSVCIDILIVPKNLRKIAPVIKEKYKIIEEYATAEGPMAGIVAALESSKYENLLVLGIDYPLVSVKLLSFILKTIEENVVKMVIPKLNRMYQPLVAAYKKQLLPLFEKWINIHHNYSLQNFIQINEGCIYTIDVTTYKSLEYELFNLNTRNDLQMVKKLYNTNQVYGKN
ncbi:MAG: molybdenum cofactor guanylyltransferase [Planctomycetota bacterium]